MRLTASEIARAVGGQLVGPDVPVDGATIDSRSIQPGQLFVPLVAERDGHEFIDGAIAAGAAAHLTSRPDTAALGPAVVVADTAAALLDLGRGARGRLPERVVGITGSVGKTTAKDILRSILAQRYATAASEKSFNNELGVPLTLVNTPAGTEAVVVEMGARGPGHIALLCSVARPTIGMVTVVAGAHLEMFGSLDGVAIAKGELIEALPSTGTAVLNADDARVLAMGARSSAPVLAFGEHAGDVRAEAVELGPDLRPRFRLVSPFGAAEVQLAVAGRHNVVNALGAAAAAFAAGCELHDVVAGLATTELSPMRMDLGRTASGVVVLDDAYNANPTSMRAALDALAELPARRRIAVLGTMAELGRESARLHREVAMHASSTGIEVVAVDEPAYGVPVVADVAAAADYVGQLAEGDAVLVKGSRVAGLERLVDVLFGR
jgi:UDP-N-acetylmuramoyl-tripeptide--D-alanyl-D-alanine ligase